MAFPEGFLWGTATASAQIEGGWNEGGRTPSIWDVAPKSKIRNDEDCHTSCDHFHRWREDIALLKKLGVRSYRFSISWSRVISSEGQVNEEGIRFYQDLVTELKENGIEPLVTVYHWDLPVWVQEKGGWLWDGIIPLFREYTGTVVRALSDKVRYWIPMNEPQCFIMNGYMTGAHAPFKKRYLALSRMTRICLTAFHESADVIRKEAALDPKIGIAMAAGAFVPENETEEAIEQARKDSFSKGTGLMSNRWWGDPLLKGESVRAFGFYYISRKYMPKIRTKLDFIGLNVYAPFQNNWYGKNDEVPAEQKNSLGWVNDGRCLYWTIRFFSERYGLPVMVTENGMCDADTVSEDGAVHDVKRVPYMKDYLRNLKRAVEEGYSVLGYQYWSLMDNFEWAEGYEPRFGIVYVDFRTQKRILKDSARYYMDVIRSNGELPDSG